MVVSSHPESVSSVSKSDVESLLHQLEVRTADPRAGIFGPQSVTWRINREAAVFLGAGRATLLQLAHPWVATALDQHSTTMSNPVGRFHGTFRVIYTMIFGTLPQALAASRHMYTLHTRIQGKLPQPVAGYGAGTHYEANERNALRWVYATLVESAVLAHNFVLPPLSRAERESYYAESKWIAELFGVGPDELPADWSAFEIYNQQMWESNVLGVSEMSRSMAHRLLRGAGSRVRPPEWYRALTAAWMPERLRQEFLLDFGPEEQRSLDRSRCWLPKLYRRLPLSIRQVGAYHEALGRLQGKPHPGWMTRTSNQFWMGQPTLMFPALER
jgi:uncharacterized protein (DUF2236 family)